MQKIDFKKSLKHLYRPSARKIVTVKVPAMQFLMIDGKGDPNNSIGFQQAIETLYPVAYTLKFMFKKGPEAIDFGVLPLEGLWWAEDMSAFTLGNKDEWLWTLMIMQPDFITRDHYSEALETVKKKKNPTALTRLRLESFREGLCAQTLHIGPFENEGPTIERMHRYIEEQGRQRKGKHHEIYLTDMRRAAPDKWKTVLRQGMA